MKNSLLYILLCLTTFGCGHSKNVRFFKDTEAFDLAKAVEDEDIDKIVHLVNENPRLLEITNSKSGSNVLDLALFLENYEVFEKLLDLGANPNFINPYSKRSILIEACKFYWKPKSYSIDLRYIKLLLKKGANPNYAVEEDFTDEKGHYQRTASPLIEASSLDLSMVKLLIKAGADPHKKLAQYQESALRSALDKIEIANYFIDSLNVNVKEPLLIIKQEDSGKILVYHIQDFVVNEFILAKIRGDKKEIAEFKKESVGIEEANSKKWKLIQKLDSMGVDFKNYKYINPYLTE